MSPRWTERLARRAIRWYPRAWRERYAEEVLEVLDQHEVRLATVLNLAANAAATRLGPDYRPTLTWRRARPTVVLLGAIGTVVALVLTVAIVPERDPEFGVTGAHDLAMSGDGRLVVASSGDTAVRLWNIADPVHPIWLSTVHAGTSVAVSPDARLLAVIGKVVGLWSISDPTNPQFITRLPDYTKSASAMAFTPDGHALALTYQGSVLFYDVTNPAKPTLLTPLPKSPGPESYGQSIFTPDGRILATKSGNSSLVTLWTVVDRQAPKALATITFGHEEFGDITFAPDGATLATATSGGHITLWNITNPNLPTIYSIVDDEPIGPNVADVNGPEIALAFGPDGKTLTSVMGSVKMTRWDASDRARCTHIAAATRDDAGPGQFRLSADGRAVISAAMGADTIKVWILP